MDDVTRTIRRWSVDTSRWPILVVAQHAPELTDAERAAALSATGRALDGNDRMFAVIHDNRLAVQLSPKQRAMIADYAKRNEQRTRQRCVCSAFVFDSIVMRAAFTAISWLKQPVVETRVFADPEEAMIWARLKLEQRQEQGYRLPMDSTFPSS